MTILSTIIRNAGIFSVTLVSLALQQKLSTNSINSLLSQKRQKKIHHAITQVATQQYIPFAFVNLNLSAKELLAFKQLKLKSKIRYPDKILDYDTTCNTSRNKFLLAIRKILKTNFYNCSEKLDSIQITSQSIFNIVNDTLEAYNKPLAIVMIRSSSKSTFATSHRWHRDGDYFNIIRSDKNYHYVKADFVLKGPGTDFIDYTDEYYNPDFTNKLQVEQLKALKSNNYSLLSNLIPNSAKIRNSIVGEIAFFKVGSIKYPFHLSAIHSEPNVDGERLYIAIIPGSVKDFENSEFLKKIIKRKDFISTRKTN